MRKVMVLVLTSILLFSMMCVPCLAIDDLEIMPVWDNIASVNLLFCFDEIDDITATVRLYSGTDSCDATLKLYQKINNGWVLIDEKSATTNSRFLSCIIEFSGEAGVEYKAEFTGTAYSNGIGEDFSFVEYGVAS